MWFILLGLLHKICPHLPVLSQLCNFYIQFITRSAVSTTTFLGLLWILDSFPPGKGQHSLPMTEPGNRLIPWTHMIAKTLSICSKLMNSSCWRELCVIMGHDDLFSSSISMHSNGTSQVILMNQKLIYITSIILEIAKHSQLWCPVADRMICRVVFLIRIFWTQFLWALFFVINHIFHSVHVSIIVAYSLLLHVLLCGSMLHLYCSWTNFIPCSLEIHLNAFKAHHPCADSNVYMSFVIFKLCIVPWD